MRRVIGGAYAALLVGCVSTNVPALCDLDANACADSSSAADSGSADATRDSEAADAFDAADSATIDSSVSETTEDAPAEAEACSPKTTCPAGQSCGTADDGCGGTLDCGTCTTPGETCGGTGNATPGVCAHCDPLLTCPSDLNCGDYFDGCGGTISCVDPRAPNYPYVDCIGNKKTCDGTCPGYCASTTRCTYAASVAVGDTFTCALMSDSHVRCWGADSFGELADGGINDQSIPVPNGLPSILQLSVGSSHACAQGSSGDLQCWGWNSYGQVGDGSTTNRNVPTAIPGFSATALSLGAAHSCAIGGNTAGLYCWGSNEWGQLGDGTTVDRHSPTAVPVTFPTSVAAGARHTCALNTDHAVLCWGENQYGQIGDGTTVAERHSPVPVAGLSNGVTQIVAGDSHTCALKDGSVVCWGLNDVGQLGDGTATNRNAPTEVVGLTGVARIFAGGKTTCAVLAGDGTVHCWGASTGDGVPGHLVPTTISALGVNPISLALGETHSCIENSSNAVQCWGGNVHGELGNGTTDTAATPTAVKWQ